MGIFGLEFENNIVVFEISAFEFIKLQDFAKEYIPYLGIFGLEFLKKLLNSAPSNFSKMSF